MKNFREYHTPEEESLEESSVKPHSVKLLESFTQTYSELNTNIELAKEYIEELRNLSEDVTSEFAKKDEVEQLFASQLLLVSENLHHLKEELKDINQNDIYKLHLLFGQIESKTQQFEQYINEELPKAKKDLTALEFTSNKNFQLVGETIKLLDKRTNDLLLVTESLPEDRKQLLVLQHETSKNSQLVDKINEEINQRISSIHETVKLNNIELQELSESYDNILTPAVNKINEFQSNIDKMTLLANDYKDNIEKTKQEIRAVVNEVNQIFINENYLELDRKLQRVEELFTSAKQLNEELDKPEAPPISPVQTGFDPGQVSSLALKVKFLEQSIGRIVATGPGSGETRLRFLDDIDASTIGNGKYLRYNSTKNKFEFATVSGGGGGTQVQSDWTQTDNTDPSFILNKPTLFSGSYNDLTNKPTIPSLTGYATESYVSTQINNLINSAPGTLDTLGEIATALQNDETALGALTTAVSSKIGLTALSVTTASASGSGSLSYNNTTGVFTFTPPVLFSGSYNDLTNKPTLFSGSYTDLTNKPTIPSALSDLTDVVLTSPTNGQVLKYDSVAGKWVNAADATGAGGTGIALTDLSVSTLSASGGGNLSYNNTTGVFTFTPPVLFSGSYTDLTNKPTLFSGSYTDLTNKPTLFSGDYNDLTNKPSIPAAQIQSDWNQTNTSSLDYIKNKPTIPSLTGYATEAYVTTQITNLINGAPTTLDTLKEIADQLAADESAVSALTSTVASKIGLTDLSVTTTSSTSGGSLTYNNTTGVFTFAPATVYTLPTATASVLGGVKVGSGLAIDGSGVLSATYSYTLPTASGSTLGGIKVGSGLTIDGSGVLSTVLQSGGNATFNNITTTGQIIETFQTYSTSIASAASVTLNCAGGNIWNITSTVSGNWTAALTNLSISTNQATNVTLIINQGVTPYIPTALTVNGTSAAINWQGGTQPTPNASKKDIIAFSILQTGASTYLVFGQLVTFG